MKALIDRNTKSSLTEQTFVKLDTQKLLSEYVDKFGLGYVIRHYEILPDLISSIVEGEYSDRCDDMFTTSEIKQYQQTLLVSLRSADNKSVQKK